MQGVAAIAAIALVPIVDVLIGRAMLSLLRVPAEPAAGLDLTYWSFAAMPWLPALAAVTFFLATRGRPEPADRKVPRVAIPLVLAFATGMWVVAFHPLRKGSLLSALASHSDVTPGQVELVGLATASGTLGILVLVVGLVVTAVATDRPPRHEPPPRLFLTLSCAAVILGGIVTMLADHHVGQPYLSHPVLTF